jgi:hypothetical protein
MTVLSKLTLFVKTKTSPRTKIDPDFYLLTQEDLPTYSQEELEFRDVLENDARYKEHFHLYLAITRQAQYLCLYDEIQRYNHAEESNKKHILQTIYDLFIKSKATFPVALDLDNNQIGALGSVIKNGGNHYKPMQWVEAATIKKLCDIHSSFQRSPRYYHFKNKHAL